MSNSLRDENPYRSPEEPIVKAELVKLPPHKETFDEAFAKMCRWGGSSVLILIMACAISGAAIGAGELCVIAIAYAAYWGPRLVEASRQRPMSRGGF
jgi:hypothetical protein